MQIPEVREDHSPYEPVRFVRREQRSLARVVQVHRREHRFTIEQWGTRHAIVVLIVSRKLSINSLQTPVHNANFAYSWHPQIFKVQPVALRPIARL